jgi:ABC-2 type transport system ATP-binding protein
MAAGPEHYQALAQALAGQLVHSDPARLAHGVATDGTAAHVRAVLDAADPRRTAVATVDLHRAPLDDVFLALTGQPSGNGAAAEGNPRRREKNHG